MDRRQCQLCGALIPDGHSSCRAVFDEVCAREYCDPAFAAVHLLTVDAYALQHSEDHGPRSNAFHLLRLCRLVEHGGNPGIGQRPPRDVGKAFESRYRELPYLEPPSCRGTLTIADVTGVSDATEHAARVWAWGRSVWDAYRRHHKWARAVGSAIAGTRSVI